MKLNSLQRKQKIGLAILIILLCFSILVGLFSPFTIEEQDLSQKLLKPSLEHWMGTDHFGRDMMTRLASAISLSFGLSLLCVFTSSILGTALGVISAWFGGKLEYILDTFVNILLALPGLVLVLLLAAIAPGSFLALYLAISLVQWIEYYRVTKVITYNKKVAPDIQLSQIMGFGKWYQFKRHIWPILFPSISTMASFGAANAILTMASLGFVYVGIQPPIAELGLMSVELFPHYTQAPWVLIQPLAAVALLVLGFHLLGGVENDNSH